MNVAGTNLSQTLLGLFVSSSALLIAMRYHLKMLFWVSIVTLLWYGVVLGVSALKHYQHKKSVKKNYN